MFDGLSNSLKIYRTEFHNFEVKNYTDFIKSVQYRIIICMQILESLPLAMVPVLLMGQAHKSCNLNQDNSKHSQ